MRDKERSDDLRRLNQTPSCGEPYATTLWQCVECGGFASVARSGWSNGTFACRIFWSRIIADFDAMGAVVTCMVGCCFDVTRHESPCIWHLFPPKLTLALTPIAQLSSLMGFTYYGMLRLRVCASHKQRVSGACIFPPIAMHGRPGFGLSSHRNCGVNDSKSFQKPRN